MDNREYQVTGINQVIEEVSTKRKIIRQLPTGGGKTVEFALLSQRYIRNTGKSVLILVHREELMWQAEKTIREVCDIDACLINSGSKYFKVSRVYIGMVDSLIRRLDLFANVGLVIVDECHDAHFNKIHSIFLEELIIGYTATPISANKKMPLNKFYSDIVCGPQIRELIDMGFLSQNITRAPKDIVDATKFQIDVLKGDYNERQMSTEYKLPRHVTNVVHNYRRFCLRKKTIIFNVTIEHSQMVNECFQACGYNSRHLASDNESERREILKWFHDTEDAILCNVGMFTVGFDEPTVLNIIINFATLSIVKFLQCCGRGGRVIDQAWIDKHQKDYPYEVQLKDRFNIIDMGANHVRHFDWCDDRDWARLFYNPHIPGNGTAPVKTCPDCEGLVHAAVRICPLMNEKGEQCLHEFQKRVVQESEKEQEMIIVRNGINVDMLINQNKKKYEYYTFTELGKPIVKAMYMTYRKPSAEIKQRYFKGYYDLCIAWYNKTLAGKNGNIDDITHSSWHIRKAKNNFNDLIRQNGGTVDEDWQEAVLVDEEVPLLTSSARRIEYKKEEDVYEW